MKTPMEPTMKTFFAIFFTSLLSLQAQAQEGFTIEANIWIKTNCSAQETCLPEPISAKKKFFIPEPAVQSFSQILADFDDYRAVIVLTKRQENGGYYGLQIDFQNSLSGETIAICSRYEGLESFETNLVGACGGRSTKFQGLIGISLTLPQ